MTSEPDRTYRDATLPVDQRVENLLGQMTLEEKAGLFFHTMIAIGQQPGFEVDSPETQIAGRGLTHFNVFGRADSAEQMADWHNEVQAIAASTRLGIPVTLSTDPRHAFSDNALAALLSGPFSQWPEALGLAAIGDEATVERFADIVRQEYTAVGLRVALHPQLDLATEPRWARQIATFGEDVDLVTRLGVAYIRGLQGASLGHESVAAMVKHFPGGGPQKDGEDPHFAYGREQVYPGNNFEHHMLPFEAAFAAGAGQVMPYYGMPVGTEYEEVGFGFNKSVITGLLRDRFHFDGIVCTDWGLLSDAEVAGQPFPARAWGVENLTTRERMLKAMNAGVDQFGGEQIPELLVELVRSGDIDEARLDVSARRLLREKFVLGLFDAGPVDVAHARTIVGSAEFRAEGDAAQRAAMTLLTNRDATLPLKPGIRVHLEGISPDALGDRAEAASGPEDADVAIVRIGAPYETRPTMFENFFHAGSLDYTEERLAELRTLCQTVPTILVVFLERPAILTPLVDEAAAIVAEFGASDAAVLDVVFGDAQPKGKLPIDIPRSMASVLAGRPDVPFDTADALFPFGHGLSY